jgi:hypothetical protein
VAGQADALIEGPTTALRVTGALTTVTAAAALTQAAAASRLAAGGDAGNTRRALFAGGAIGGVGLAWFLASNNLAFFPF